MKRRVKLGPISSLILVMVISCPVWAQDVVRPEEVKSKREVVYSEETYRQLEQLWHQYYDAYPSEYAYANWMYAARYASDERYVELLDRGVRLYPGNPTLLYLKALQVGNEPESGRSMELSERAVELDPGFTDPWFNLVIDYMRAGEDEKFRLALRRLIESGAISEEVMDYNYNVLQSLDENAILLTNGDNDTYPVWVLTEILGVRPDVNVVNRSMLNLDWYPLYLIEHGLPKFTWKNELEGIRRAILKADEKEQAGGSIGGLFSDTLVSLLIGSAERAGRPFYLAGTLYYTEKLKQLAQEGRELGLVTLVTPVDVPYQKQLRRVYGAWLADFRTAGVDAWRLRYAPETDAGRMLASNYGRALASNLGALEQNAPELLLPLFQWYRDHVDAILSEDFRYRIAYAWCCSGFGIGEVEAWCRAQGLKCRETTE